MKINKKHFKLKIEKGCIDLSINISKYKEMDENDFNFDGLRKKIKIIRYFVLNYSNKKEQIRIWGKNSCYSKYHFYLYIPKIITIDTAHIGKKIFNTELNITSLFNKDLMVYTIGESDIQSC